MQKLLIFFRKNISIYTIFDDKSFYDMLTNNIVSFEQLGPVIHIQDHQKFRPAWVCKQFVGPYPGRLYRGAENALFQLKSGFYKKIYICIIMLGVLLKSTSRATSVEYPQHMFLWRNKGKYIFRYPLSRTMQNILVRASA